jgi:V/A-type H+-transporting ATPase subunit B
MDQNGNLPIHRTYGGERMLTGLGDLLRYTHATAIVGDILKMRASDIGLGDMAIVEMGDGDQSLAQVIQLEGEEVSLQVFGGGKGLSTQAMAFDSPPTITS